MSKSDFAAYSRFVARLSDERLVEEENYQRDRRWNRGREDAEQLLEIIQHEEAYRFRHNVYMSGYQGASPERAAIRSETYPGIANTMADQWGG